MITLTELLERAKSEHIAIHTQTEKQAITLLTELEKRGYMWFSGNMWLSGKKLTATTRYEDYEENTCYEFYDNDGKLLDKKIMYGPLEFYQDEGYTIIELKASLIIN